MHQEEFTTPDARPGDGGAGSSEGEGTGSNESLKDILAKALGKEFKSDEAALAYVQENEKFTGKVKNYAPVIQKLESKFSQGDAVNRILSLMDEKPVDSSQFVSRAEFEEQTFFAKNPELVEHKPLLEALVAKEGSYEKAAQSEAFKSVYEKAKAFDETEKSRSVLQGNARLGSVGDKLTQAKEFAQAGNERAAAETATQAVIEAYGLK